MNTEALGRAFWKARQKSKLGLAQVAGEAGFSCHQLFEIERGKRTPSLLEVDVLARVLKVSLTSPGQGVRLF